MQVLRKLKFGKILTIRYSKDLGINVPKVFTEIFFFQFY